MTVNRWERGVCPPRADYMELLREFLKMGAAAVKMVATRAGLRRKVKLLGAPQAERGARVRR